MRRTHNYKIRMQAKNGGLFTITRNAISPEQAKRYAESEHENSTGAIAIRAWKNADAPDPRDWHQHETAKAVETVRCPDHRNGGATYCPRGGAALQIWQRQMWGDR